MRKSLSSDTNSDVKTIETILNKTEMNLSTADLVFLELNGSFKDYKMIINGILAPKAENI